MKNIILDKKNHLAGININRIRYWVSCTQHVSTVELSWIIGEPGKNLYQADIYTILTRTCPECPEKVPPNSDHGKKSYGPWTAAILDFFQKCGFLRITFLSWKNDNYTKNKLNQEHDQAFVCKIWARLEYYWWSYGPLLVDSSRKNVEKIAKIAVFLE